MQKMLKINIMSTGQEKIAEKKIRYEETGNGTQKRVGSQYHEVNSRNNHQKRKNQRPSHFLHLTLSLPQQL
jgi:hypothetical protein